MYHSSLLGRSLVRLVLSALFTLGVTQIAWAGGDAMAAPSAAADSIDAQDAQALETLREAGWNLKKPTSITHYLYIPKLADAKAAVALITKTGFTATLHPPLGRLSDGTTESRYSVIAENIAIPSMGELRRARALFEKLAARYGGDYDGWEAKGRR